MYDIETEKWPLYVCVTETQSPDHRKIVAKLLNEIGEHGYTKDEIIKMRDMILSPAV